MRSKDSYRSGKRNKMKGAFVPLVKAREGSAQAGEARGKSFVAHGALANFFFPGSHQQGMEKLGKKLSEK